MPGNKKEGPNALSTNKAMNINVPSIQPSHTPTVLNTEFPIVGIGASAGGLAAFQAFFAGILPNTLPNMAFLVVQHLAPDHQSLLSELVQHVTHLKVFEVTDGMQVQINCVYIIPPNCDMALLHGTLQLLEPVAPRGHRLPIDFLFNSLAEDLRERAIGIVLSGTGSDGTAGVRAIKNAGGMVMTQSVETSEFDGMPSSAVATGLVDFELQPADMPVQLLSYIGHIVRRPHSPANTYPALDSNALKKIFVILRAHIGHDFSQYKPSTICRRIERRMAVRQIDDIHAYVNYLQQTPLEVDALFQDLLIGVTQFFRDKDAFAVLENQIIPKLFDDKDTDSAIRVWCAGCSTGEEAYSIAILLFERREILEQNFKIQVFATDIDSRAIVAARAGRFPSSIESQISPERLARFFTADVNGEYYRIHKNIRDLMVFSEHNLINDPPFSKLDLITCRNLLIYINSELQKKLITLFHYALKPGAMMFLGTSETVGQSSNLFTIVDRKAKVYQRKDNEELATVNAEQQAMVGDLSRANNDMNNLLAGTGIATVFVDHQLLILRFTPAATEIINFIQGDIGRAIGHIVSNLVGYTKLVADIQLVLKTLTTKEIDVQTTNQNWYTMRIMPYRTLDNVVEGAVITFVNITEVVRIRETLRKANEQMFAQVKYKIYKANHKL